MARTRDELDRAFFDELLGMAVRTSPTEELARGLFIRERQLKVRTLLDRLHMFYISPPTTMNMAALSTSMRSLP